MADGPRYFWHKSEIFVPRGIHLLLPPFHFIWARQRIKTGIQFDMVKMSCILLQELIFLSPLRIQHPLPFLPSPLATPHVELATVGGGFSGQRFCGHHPVWWQSMINKFYFFFSNSSKFRTLTFISFNRITYFN